MRCKACNGMIGAWWNAKAGDYEDLCTRCRSWIYVGLDDDFKSEEYSASCAATDAEALGLDIELDEDNIMDRNHELPNDLFDSYGRE